MTLAGKTAYVNLSTGAVKTESIPVGKRKLLLGGRGFNIEHLVRMSSATDALASENIIAVGVGLLSGMVAPGACRTSIASKSPLTGYLANADIGGFFAPELRRAGFDQLVFTGRAKKPTLAFVHDGRITLHDASSIWGHNIPETQEILRKRFEDDDIQILCVGPAGENQVRFATVSTRYHGASRQGGIGAVFGSKNLKAIVAKGTDAIPIQHPKEALQYDLETEKRMASSEFGTGGRSHAITLSGGEGEDTFAEQTVGPEGCYGCQFQCERRIAIRSGPYAGVYGYAPGRLISSAWEEVFGGLDANAILYVNCLTDSLGLDRIETPGLISWAIELSSRGILTHEDAGGLSFSPVSVDAASRLIAMIASKKGLGGILAEGPARAADRLGRSSALFLKEIRGTTNVLFDGSGTPWQALGTATSSTISEHERFQLSSDPGRLRREELANVLNATPNVGLISSNLRDYSNAPSLVFWAEMCGTCLDMLGICDFRSVLFDPDFLGFEEFSRLLALNADLEMKPREMWDAAERVSNMERLLNLRFGYNPKAEKLGNWCPGVSDSSEACLNEVEFDATLARYYSLRGWDSNGIPTPETLKRLGVESPKGEPGV